MTKTKWGNKLTCQNCGAKFYDLKKKQPVCPKCKTEYVTEKPKTRRAPTSVEPAPVPVPDSKKSETDEDELIDVDLEEDLIEDDSDEEDDTVMEDTSDIGRDEDDIDEVIGVVDSKNDEDS